MYNNMSVKIEQFWVVMGEKDIMFFFLVMVGIFLSVGKGCTQQEEAKDLRWETWGWQLPWQVRRWLQN